MFYSVLLKVMFIFGLVCGDGWMNGWMVFKTFKLRYIDALLMHLFNMQFMGCPIISFTYPAADQTVVSYRVS